MLSNDVLSWSVRAHILELQEPETFALTRRAYSFVSQYFIKTVTSNIYCLCPQTFPITASMHLYIRLSPFDLSAWLLFEEANSKSRVKNWAADNMHGTYTYVRTYIHVRRKSFAFLIDRSLNFGNEYYFNWMRWCLSQTLGGKKLDGVRTTTTWRNELVFLALILKVDLASFCLRRRQKEYPSSKTKRLLLVFFFQKVKYR